MFQSILLLVIICISAQASQDLKGQNSLLPGEHKYRLIVKFAPDEVLDRRWKAIFSTDRFAPPFPSIGTLQKFGSTDNPIFR